jgi:hypothetical protein
MNGINQRTETMDIHTTKFSCLSEAIRLHSGDSSVQIESILADAQKMADFVLSVKPQTVSKPEPIDLSRVP